jgi:hypothetical protein
MSFQLHVSASYMLSLRDGECGTVRSAEQRTRKHISAF